MAGEIPECKRCCFCLPLRYGLLVWGYIKLLVGLFLLVVVSLNFFSDLMSIPVSDSKDEGNETRGQINKELIIIIIGTIILLIDFVLSTVFLIGGHMKIVKILKIYYFYSIGFWVAILMLTIFAIASSVMMWFSLEGDSVLFWIYNILRIPNFFVGIVIQTYFLILLKSEIVKLSNDTQFRFVNNAAESELTMKYGEEQETKKTLMTKDHLILSVNKE